MGFKTRALLNMGARRYQAATAREGERVWGVAAGRARAWFGAYQDQCIRIAESRSGQRASRAGARAPEGRASALFSVGGCKLSIVPWGGVTKAASQKGLAPAPHVSRLEPLQQQQQPRPADQTGGPHRMTRQPMTAPPAPPQKPPLPSQEDTQLFATSHTCPLAQHVVPQTCPEQHSPF